MAWEWFDGLPEKAKEIARRRLLILQKVEAMEERSRARDRHVTIVLIARAEGVGVRTVWEWFAQVEGIRPDDRLPYLAPKHRAAKRKSQAKDCSPEFFEVIKSDYLRLEAPPFLLSFQGGEVLVLGDDAPEIPGDGPGTGLLELHAFAWFGHRGGVGFAADDDVAVVLQFRHFVIGDAVDHPHQFVHRGLHLGQGLAHPIQCGFDFLTESFEEQRQAAFHQAGAILGRFGRWRGGVLRKGGQGRQGKGQDQDAVFHDS